MKIFIFTPFFYPDVSGVSRATESMAYGLMSINNNFEIIIGTTTHSDKDEVMTYEKYDLHNSGKIVDVLRFKNSFVFNSSKSFKLSLLNEIKKVNPTHIIFHAWQCDITDCGIQAATEFGKAKISVVSHGVNFHQFVYPGIKGLLRRIKWFSYKRKINNLINKIDCLFVLSMKSKSPSFYDRQLAISKSVKVYEVWNSIFDEEFSMINLNMTSLKPNKQYYIAIGNYSPLKRFELAIDLFLKNNIDDSTFIVVGGGDNDYYHNLEVKYKFSNKVQFLVNIPRIEILYLLKNARAIVVSSYIEVQPVVIIEAILLGTPFISLDIGCISDIDGGVIINPEIDDLSDIFNRSKDSLLALTGFEAARSEVISKTSATRNANLIVNALNNI